jgi:alanine racemase
MGSASQNLKPLSALTWAEIDLEALAHNYREFKRLTAPGADIMAVVKADGYGHGAVQVARTALANGARFLAVARLEEAIQLRESGIAAPILLFGYSPPDYVDKLASLNIWASINSLDAAMALSSRAVQQSKTVCAHIKVDTGMGRLGVMADEIALSENAGEEHDNTVKTILAITALPNIKIEGIFTHFANADSLNKSHARDQLAIFTNLLDTLKNQGIEFKYRHAANSAATIEMPDSHLDLVRPGISQYGLWPSPEVDRSLIDLKPVMAIKSRIIQVKEVGPGFKVSYGSTHVTAAQTRIATIPIGYADGYDRILSSRGHMLVRGKRAPIIGRVCMDLTMLDVGHIPETGLDDEVVILGTQGTETMTADEIAERVGTINYEIVSSLTSRVPKIFLSGD